MSDIYQYLKWRGDLTFDQDFLNEADYVVFSRLSYLPFERSFYKKNATILDYLIAMEGPYLMNKDKEFVSLLLKSPRYYQLKVLDWSCDFNKEQVKQFFAITFFDDKGNCYMSFRGTDSTIVGWQEDFRMSYTTPVRAQLDSKKYFKSHVSDFKYFYLFGHSKGGNLSSYVYFTANQKEKKKIKSVVNLDGPGFQASKVTTLFKGAEMQKIHYYVPQGSVVGRLLVHEASPIIVYSTRMGIFQHDIYSWNLNMNKFCRDNEITSPSIITEITIKDWVSHMSCEEQEVFVNNIFSLFCTGDNRTLKDVRVHFIKNLPEVRDKMAKMDDKTKRMMRQIIKLLFKAQINSFLIFSKEKKNEKNLIANYDIDSIMDN